MKYLAIIQARMNSTRLPGKVNFKINRIPILEHVINRVSRSKLIDEIVVATSLRKDNLPIINLCSNIGVLVYAGSEEDVLDRYYQVASILSAENIVRITADCPLHDPIVIDKIIQQHVESSADYTSNVMPATYPDGLDVEVLKINTLKVAWEKAKLKSDREHVTPYI